MVSAPTIGGRLLDGDRSLKKIGDSMTPCIYAVLSVIGYLAAERGSVYIYIRRTHKNGSWSILSFHMKGATIPIFEDCNLRAIVIMQHPKHRRWIFIFLVLHY